MSNKAKPNISKPLSGKGYRGKSHPLPYPCLHSRGKGLNAPVVECVDNMVIQSIALAESVRMYCKPHQTGIAESELILLYMVWSFSNMSKKNLARPCYLYDGHLITPQALNNRFKSAVRKGLLSISYNARNGLFTSYSLTYKGTTHINALNKLVDRYIRMYTDSLLNKVKVDDLRPDRYIKAKS